MKASEIVESRLRRGASDVSAKITGFKLRKEDTGAYPEQFSGSNAWMGPDGLVYSLGISSHGEWAKNRMAWEGPAAPKNFEAERYLKERGWIRLSRERGESRPAVFIDTKSRISPKQEAALEAFMNERPGVEFVDVSTFDSRFSRRESVQNKARDLVQSLLESPQFTTLKKAKKPLDKEEREKAMKAGAIWHHGPGGTPSCAIWKADVRGKTWYVCATHRAYQAKPTLKGAIKAFEFIKTTA